MRRLLSPVMGTRMDREIVDIRYLNRREIDLRADRYSHQNSLRNSLRNSPTVDINREMTDRDSRTAIIIGILRQTVEDSTIGNHPLRKETREMQYTNSSTISPNLVPTILHNSTTLHPVKTALQTEPLQITTAQYYVIPQQTSQLPRIQTRTRQTLIVRRPPLLWGTSPSPATVRAPL